MYDHQRYAVYHANNVFEMALPPAGGCLAYHCPGAIYFGGRYHCLS